MLCFFTPDPSEAVCLATYIPKENKMRRFVFLAALMCVTAVPAKAQDAATADPQHFKIDLENDQVRVLHYRLGPHEKTAVHEHLRPHVEIQLTIQRKIRP
jgi:hypothetical protein